MSVSKLKPGFTLVELMLVIAVMAILAGITTLSIRTWQDRSANNEVQHDLRQAANELKSERNFKSYPTTQAAFDAIYPSSEGVTLVYRLRGDGSYCLNATSTKRTQIRWHIDSRSESRVNTGHCTV